MKTHKVALSILEGKVAQSYLNEQGNVLYIPDFDEASDTSFPNSIRIGDALISAGRKASTLDLASNSPYLRCFNWTTFNASFEEDSVSFHLESLYAIGKKCFRDASVFLHSESISLAIVHPAGFSSESKEAIKATFKKCGYSDIQLVEQTHCLFNNALSQPSVNQTLHVEVQADALYIARADVESKGFITDSFVGQNYGSRVINHSLELELTKLFEIRYPGKDLTDSGRSQIAELAKQISAQFTDQTHKFQIDLLIDHFAFSVELTHIHFSKFIMTWVNKLISNLQNFLQSCPASSIDLVSNVPIPDFALSSMKSRLLIDLNYRYVTHKDYHSGAFSALCDQVHSAGQVIIEHDNEVKITVQGFDTKRNQMVYDVISETTGNGGSSALREYQLKTNSKGLCSVPLAINSLKGNKSSQGHLLLKAAGKAERSIKINLLFDTHFSGKTTISIHENSPDKVDLEWVNKAEYLDFREMELF